MTDYKKVKIRLRAALKEYKKDGSGDEQLSTDMSRRLCATPFSAETYDLVTWEDAIESLIRSVCVVQGREKSGLYSGDTKASFDQEGQCGTCKSIDKGKAQVPCYECNDFDKWTERKIGED